MKKTHKEITKALVILRPNSEWALRGDDYSNLEWLDDKSLPPTWAEVEAEINNPTPTPEPTIEQKLASVGLSVDDLKTALGL
jgi:hypothetical protein